MKTIVVDAICGKGKSSWAILNATFYEKGRFLYVTPYLTEIDRFVGKCKEYNVTVYTPDSKRGRGSKAEHLRELLVRGENVAMTHALFDYIDVEMLEVIKQHGYTLYLDEVHEVINRYNITKDDLALLTEQDLIGIDDKGLVTWLDNEYTGKFEEFKNLCNLGSMYRYKDELYIWCFPCSVFEAMSKTYILTYMFEGQLQCYYYKLHGMEYEKRSVEGSDEVYGLCPWKEEEYKKDIEEVSSLISIYEGNLNYSKKGFTLSSSWLNNKNNEVYHTTIKNNVYNFMRHHCNGSSDDNMWTTLKSLKNKLKGKTYTKGFVPLNARATNMYSHKKNLAYIYNRYLNPIEANFFRIQGVGVNEEDYAISELLQWVFRSAIRRGEKINLYLPSERMRTLYYKWIGK